MQTRLVIQANQVKS